MTTYLEQFRRNERRQYLISRSLMVLHELQSNNDTEIIFLPEIESKEGKKIFLTIDNLECYFDFD